METYAKIITAFEQRHRRRKCGRAAERRLTSDISVIVNVVTPPLVAAVVLKPPTWKRAPFACTITSGRTRCPEGRGFAVWAGQPIAM